MSQFLGFAIFFIILAGLILQSAIELPWYLSWVGNLPGDMIIKKKYLTIYVPLTSSALVSLLFSFISSLFTGRK